MMADHPDQIFPDEGKLEQLFQRFEPHPSPRFYAKMASAPWLNQSPQSNKNAQHGISQNRRLIWAAAALFLVTVILTIVFVPSVRVAADQIIHLFLPQPSNQLEVQVELASPGDIPDFSDPANFSLTLQDAQQHASIPLKSLPYFNNLAFIGARYDPSYDTVTMLYRANEYDLFLIQRPSTKGQDVFTIGADAQVELVKIGAVQGEYVTGGWKAVSTQPAPVSNTPAVQVIAVWDDSLPLSILRWVANGVVYELRCNGSGCPAQPDLILLANELQ